MEITIENTIKNAHIVPPKSQPTPTKRGSSKQVSFKEENNSYHNLESTRNSSEIGEEEYKDLEIESRFFREIGQQELHIEPKN